MNRKISVFLVIMVVCLGLVGFSCSSDNSKPEELESLGGTWTVTAWEIRGSTSEWQTSADPHLNGVLQKYLYAVGDDGSKTNKITFTFNETEGSVQTIFKSDAEGEDVVNRVDSYSLKGDSIYVKGDVPIDPINELTYSDSFAFDKRTNRLLISKKVDTKWLTKVFRYLDDITLVGTTPPDYTGEIVMVCKKRMGE